MDGLTGLEGSERKLRDFELNDRVEKEDTHKASKSLSSFDRNSPCIVCIRAHNSATSGIERYVLKVTDSSLTAYNPMNV